MKVVAPCFHLIGIDLQMRVKIQERGCRMRLLQETRNDLEVSLNVGMRRVKCSEQEIDNRVCIDITLCPVFCPLFGWTGLVNTLNTAAQCCIQENCQERGGGGKSVVPGVP